MEIKVKHCKNCPFRYSDINEHCIGNDTLEICTLARFMKLNNYTIANYDSFYYINYEVPEWCPLRDNQIIVNNSF